MKAPDNEPINISLLFQHSPLYRKLSQQPEVKKSSDLKEDLPPLVVLKHTITAEDAMRTIEIFDFAQKFQFRQVIFYQNTSGDDWSVFEKNKTDCKLKFATSFKAPETLQDTSAYNWLESKEIIKILEEKKLLGVINFNSSLDQCFENNKNHEFHVRTLFCNYLSENLPTNDSLATLDLDDLILKNFGAGVNKLKFNESDKFDFKYLFPVDEKDLSKVKTFYCDGEAGQEKMISKVVKILDKYYEDLEREDIEKINIKTFDIVEKAIAQIIKTKNQFGDDCQFPKEDYEKIVKFRGNFSKEDPRRFDGEPYKNPPAPKDDEWTLFKPFEDFFQNLLGSSSEKKVNSGQQNGRTSERKSPNFMLHTEGKYGSKDEPSNFLQEIIDVICCVNPNRKNR